ncbi:MAG TPA: hypothetical protein VFM29_01265 [Vicinamibacteria bacterium]|nr:hypothetical protein [Vicinamibacteria bacterium]
MRAFRAEPAMRTCGTMPFHRHLAAIDSNYGLGGIDAWGRFRG